MATTPSAFADQQVRAATSDYERTVGEGLITGLITGCATGAVVGLLSGRSGNPAQGCLIGGAAGGIGGAMFGLNVAEQKKAQIQRENQLDSAISKARAQNGSLRKLVGSVDALVVRRRKELAALEATPDRTAESARLKTDLAADVGDVDQAIAAAQKSRDTLRKAVDAYRNTPEERPLSREISTNGGALDTLKARRKDLLEMRATL
ncbi:hypothetical protein GCM10007301_38970 [Azorhizobium oxalatiphilum]|uniref:Glycine zipper domain-containing protein n=1 Tax=Azorhizobium oxalatiphilum TaxID=980631 RepID=A0A917C739_9HYPH|nr:glycine zipper domain-containing protein [Azorhizobium oxalatiphilum]GGF75286.1 hypothetical protein GCM10007301_38970 [Azorhizobium oxalatiphilum]